MNRLLRDFATFLFPGMSDRASIPPLDGPWTANNAIELGDSLCLKENLIDAVLLPDGDIVLAHGSRLSRRDPQGNVVEVCVLPGAATCIAVSDDQACVGIEGIGVVWVDLSAGPEQDIMPATTVIISPTSVTFDSRGRVWVTQGSSERLNSEWQRDLLTEGSTGRVLRFDDPASDAEVLATGLEWPAGISAAEGDTVVVSEAWTHRLVRLGAVGEPQVLLADLPGYPGALTPTRDGGHCVALFAPRTKIVDFVMSEPRFRDRMLEELDPLAWVAPALRTTGHPLEQVQGGQLRVFGKTKPWAPCRSFGLMARLDADWRPQHSIHSRSDGARHGITRGWETETGYIVVSAGASELVNVNRSVAQ